MAHRGILAAGGDTVAFIAIGIDHFTAVRNRELASEIGAKGSLASEFPISTPVLAASFPRRNWRISQRRAPPVGRRLADHRKARLPTEEVFAVPGSIARSERVAAAIDQAGRQLIKWALDVLEELRWGAPRAAQPAIQRSLATPHRTNCRPPLASTLAAWTP